MQFNTYKIEIEYKVYFSLVSSYSNTGSIRDDPFWTSRKNSLELIELSSSINKPSLVEVSSCCNTGSIRDDPYWTSRKNSLELVELSNINKLKLIQILSSLPDNLHLHASLRTAFLSFAFYP